MAPYTDVFLYDVICVPTSEECADEVATARGDVEQRTLERRGKIEAWVENVTNRGEKRVHVPDQRGGRHSLEAISSLNTIKLSIENIRPIKD